MNTSQHAALTEQTKLMRPDLTSFAPIARRRCPAPDRSQECLAKLLCQCGNGNTAAFAHLHRMAVPGLRRYASRLTSQHDLLDDIVQESMIAIWRQAASYAPHLAGPMTWMHAIVRHKTFDHFRAQRVRESADAQFFNNSMDQELTTASPCSVIEVQQRAAAIAACLQQLLASRRRAIELAYMQDLTHEEVAHTMQRPLGTVKTWIRRGVLDLRRQMSMHRPCARPGTPPHEPALPGAPLVTPGRHYIPQGYC